MPSSRTPPVGQQHDVVADALDVGDHVRRDHDRRLRLGDAVHQQLQELAAGERVEAGERLVEQEQLRPLPEREREREPGALARGQRRRPRCVDATARSSSSADELVVPARVRPARELERVSPTVKER